MSGVNVELVKKLRDLTGASIKICKEIIDEVGDNFDEALKQVKIKCVDVASSKKERETKEGIFCVKNSNDFSEVSVIRLNCETDFVAKNEKFQKLASDLAQCSIDNSVDTTESILSCKIGSESVSDVMLNSISVLGENIEIGNVFYKKTSSFVASYVHNSYGDQSSGKIVSIVFLDGVKDIDSAKNEKFFKQLAMHVVASSPASLSVESLDSSFVEREKEIYMEQLKDSGKPKEILEKIIAGKMSKFYESCVFLEQKFVIDDSKKVKEALDSYNKENNSSVSITGFKVFAWYFVSYLFILIF